MGGRYRCGAAFTSASGVQTVAAGTLVAGPNGDIYSYVGQTDGSAEAVNPNDIVQVGQVYYKFIGAAQETFDLSGAADANPADPSPNFTDPTTWTKIASPASNAVILPYGAVVDLSKTNFRDTTLWRDVAGETPNFNDATKWALIAGTPGATYRYVGPATTLDINNQDYHNTALWVQVGFVDTAPQGTSPQPTALTAGDTVTRSGEREYTYVGPSQTLDINAQDYANPALWAPVGSVNVLASESATIKATSFAAAVSFSIGGETGVSVAGGGSTAENLINATTSAYISNSTLNSVGAVAVDATDASVIDATVASIAASVALGGSNGVGVAIGVSYAHNRISDGTEFGNRLGRGLPSGKLDQRQRPRRCQRSGRGNDQRNDGSSRGQSGGRR